MCGRTHGLCTAVRAGLPVKVLSRRYALLVHGLSTAVWTAVFAAVSVDVEHETDTLLPEAAVHFALIVFDAGLIEGVDVEQIAAHGDGVLEEVQKLSERSGADRFHP